MAKEKLYLIDAMAFCYRGFYALRNLSTSSGFPTNAIYGFMNVLKKVLREEKPRYLGICFDVSRDTFRQRMFESYKIQRAPTPDELSLQIPVIKEILSAYNLAVIQKEGYEADDIIATIAEEARRRGMKVIVISMDKDILQLVDDDLEVLCPQRDRRVVYDKEKVEENYGIKPRQIIDLIALMGDNIDNIPGITGIGDKTAAELIGEFGSIENLILKSKDIKSQKIRKAIEENEDVIKRNKELITLKTDVPLDLEIEDLKVGEPDYKKLYEIFRRLEFKSMLKDLPLVQEKRDDIEICEIKDEDLEDYSLNAKEVGIALETADGDPRFCQIKSLFLFIGGKALRIQKIGIKAKRILADENIKKIGYDLKNILLCLKNNHIELRGLGFDVIIAAYILDSAKDDYSLGAIAWDYLKMHIAERLTKEEELDIVSRLKDRLFTLIKERNLARLFYEVEMPLIEVLAVMEATGVALDIKFLNRLSDEVGGRLDSLIKKIYSLAGYEFNINSPKQLAQVLFVHLKLKPARKTKTGYSTDESVLRQLKDEHPLPQLLLEYRQLSKLKFTYIDVLPTLVNSNTHRVHTSFNQTATETGRLSSSNPNLQNIPIKTEIGQKIRGAFVPSLAEDFILSADYSQIELRILAHLSGDKNMIEAFRNNQDIHLRTASLLYGIDEKDVNSAMREVAKRVNFGIIYGMSNFGLAKDLGISNDEAQTFIESYFQRYPRVKEFIDACKNQARKEGFVTTILGRRRYIPQINSKNQTLRLFSERQAINAPVQGSCADMIKLAMVNIQRLINQRELKSRMILQVHDELVFEVDRQEKETFFNLVKYEMENVVKLCVPIKVDLKYGKNWLELKSV